VLDPRITDRRNLVTGGMENLLDRAAQALDLQNPLGFLGADRSYTRLTRTCMHTDVQMLYGSNESPSMQKVGMQVLDEIDRFDDMLNIWRTDSELAVLNRTAHEKPIKVSPELFEMVKLARHYYHKTKGAFDITATPLIRLWGFFSRNPRVPSEAEIEKTKENVGMNHLVLDEENKTIFFRKKGIELTPASMGKGMALDYAIRISRSQGLHNVLLNGGFSSVLASGAPLWKDHWQFDIRNPVKHEKPLAIARLRDMSFSTSGSELQHFVHEGKTYGHIVDPRTGWPVYNMLSVSVFTKNAAEAEILSTAFYVMGVEKTLRYCENYKNIGVLILCLPVQSGRHEILSANINEDFVEVISKSC
jgi:FAD:protein FMN transferase